MKTVYLERMRILLYARTSQKIDLLLVRGKEEELSWITLILRRLLIRREKHRRRLKSISKLFL